MAVENVPRVIVFNCDTCLASVRIVPGTDNNGHLRFANGKSLPARITYSHIDGETLTLLPADWSIISHMSYERYNGYTLPIEHTEVFLCEKCSVFMSEALKQTVARRTKRIT